MKSKIEATIYAEHLNKPLKLVGKVDEIHYELSYSSDYPTMTLDLRDVTVTQDKTSTMNTDDYIEIDGKNFISFDLVGFIDNLIQERLKVAKSDE